MKPTVAAASKYADNQTYTFTYDGDEREITLSGQTIIGTTATFTGKQMTLTTTERIAGEVPGVTGITTLTLAGDETYSPATATITIMYAKESELTRI